MAITDAKKVDYLWKKLGYGVAKTDTNAEKKAPNEAITSPLLLNGANTWNQASSIPGTIPTDSSGAVVDVFTTGGPKETSNDGTAAANRTWKTDLTDWIPPEFGSTYQVKVYIHTSSDSSGAAAGGDQVFATGSGNDDEWFFDYQAGTLHFIGTNLPNGISFTGKSVYISGARYVGEKGLQNVGGNTGDISFSGNQIQSSSNADIQFTAGGTGGYQFDGNTGLTLPTGTTAQRPTAELGIIRFNTTTGKYEGSTDGSTFVSFNTGSPGATITKDVFTTSDASTTEFTLTLDPETVNNIIVYVDNVMQEPTQNYTLVGSTLTMTEALHDGARLVVMHGFD